MKRINFKQIIEMAITTVGMMIVWFGINCLAGISISFLEIMKFVVTALVSVVIVKKIYKKKP